MFFAPFLTVGFLLRVEQQDGPGPMSSQRKERKQINIVMARMTIDFTDRRYRFMSGKFGGKQDA